MTVYAVLPGDVDDPNLPSGGNVYDRRVCRELAARGTDIHETAVPGTWPWPDATSRSQLRRWLSNVPDGAIVLLDGIVGCGVPEVVVAHAKRLSLAILVHMPLADETGLSPEQAAQLDRAERRSLHAADAIVATSPLAAQRLVRHHGLPGDSVHVVSPGTDPALPAHGTDGRSHLLCVAAVTPGKGHDVLIEALSRVADLPWSCELVGPIDRDRAYANRIARLIEGYALGDRVRMTGPLTGEALDNAYAAADLVVLPSRTETYGMVVVEALAREIPVIASAVPDALGDGGLLLPPGDASALVDGLRNWLGDSRFRSRLRAAAKGRRGQLPTWEATASRLAAVLATLGA